MDFNAIIRNRETGPQTAKDIEYYVIRYRAALYEYYDRYEVNSDGEFVKYYKYNEYNVSVFKYTVLPLLFGFIPLWDEQQSVDTPADVERAKDKYSWWFRKLMKFRLRRTTVDVDTRTLV
jgi:hypothetical protein